MAQIRLHKLAVAALVDACVYSSRTTCFWSGFPCCFCKDTRVRLLWTNIQNLTKIRKTLVNGNAVISKYFIDIYKMFSFAQICNGNMPVWIRHLCIRKIVIHPFSQYGQKVTTKKGIIFSKIAGHSCWTITDNGQNCKHVDNNIIGIRLKFLNSQPVKWLQNDNIPLNINLHNSQVH